jgi:hypothetical protein
VCPARSRLIAKVVGSLAVGRANVLETPAFVARAKAADRRLGTKRQSWRRAEPITIGFGSSPALTQLYEYWRREGRAFGDEPKVAKAAE